MNTSKRNKSRIQPGALISYGLLFLVIFSSSAWSDYLSTDTLVADASGRQLYVLQKTGSQIDVVDIDTLLITKTISAEGPLGGAALSPDGKTLYVTQSTPDGKMHFIDTLTGNIKTTLPMGHTPQAIVCDNQNQFLYVCNRFNHSVSVVDVASHKVISEISTVREPFAATMTPDGKYIYIANHLPAGASDTGYTSAVVSVIDTTQNTVVKTITLPNGSINLKDICVSPDGNYIYVTQLLARYQSPTTQLDRGWMNTNAMSIIDAKEMKWINTVLLDDIDMGAANPWGVACTDDGATICIALSGTHEICVIDRIKLHDRLEKTQANQNDSSGTQVSNDLSFLHGIKQRFAIKGKGPRSITTVDSTIFFSEYYSDSVGVLDWTDTSVGLKKSVVFGENVEPSKIRQGEMLFHDASICFQKWQSCASCHPGDARIDGLNWDLLNDGMGNPKNTKSMLLAHKTPPAMSLGVRGTAETAVRAGIRHIQFVVRPEEDAQAIDEYLKSLKPVPSPYLNNGTLSDSAVRGKAVFKKAECSKCHSGSLYTDLKRYDVGTGRDRHVGDSFDTPSLVELWRTAPYLYDGRAVTIQEVLTTYNPDDKHGKTSGLSEKELSDLEQYLLSL
ncbi:MAG: cell surface protein [Planctomycetota bacterium]|jgi:YVTN family beta-propeller protein